MASTKRRPRKRAVKTSPPTTPEMKAEMRVMYDKGMSQHDIAAHFRVNQGRVSEAVSVK
jgi:hypothetical protein